MNSYLLENYLDENPIIDSSILSSYEKFGYDNEDLYLLHLNFMLKNLYDIKIVENKRKRLNQKEFRECLINKYKCCIVSSETCLDELAAAHIIPINEKENYDIDNGLLLCENLHKTFDKYKWSINPETLMIEIKKNCNVGSIKKYENKILNINMNPILRKNLYEHYKNFQKN